MRKETRALPRWRRRATLAVLAFEALGSLAGGPLLVASPDGRYMKMPVEIMHGAFASFLVPGFVLTALGLLNAIAFVVLQRRLASSWLWVGAALVGMLIWFVVELAIVGAGSWAQAAWGVPVLLGLYTAWPLVEGHAPRGHAARSAA